MAKYFPGKNTSLTQEHRSVISNREHFDTKVAVHITAQSDCSENHDITFDPKGSCAELGQGLCQRLFIETVTASWLTHGAKLIPVGQNAVLPRDISFVETKKERRQPNRVESRE